MSLLERLPLRFQLALGRWWLKHVSRQHGPKGLRRQTTDLTLEDLRQTPVWEFALDEEGEPGQDEETLKPRPDLAEVDPEKGLFVVSTSFEAAGGTLFSGFAIAQAAAEAEPGYIQPTTIITEDGQVDFWWRVGWGVGGWDGSSERDPEEEAVRSYKSLGVSRDELFPITWKMNVGVKDGPTEGILPGFGYRRDFSSASEEWVT